MSIPWCGPCGRRAPYSLLNSTVPRTGKTIWRCGFGLGNGGRMPGSTGNAAADPAAKPRRANTRSARAVVRMLTMRGRSRSKRRTLAGAIGGFWASRPSLESLLVNIAVCVKEVPDSGVTKRIDPNTMRLDRSGEGGLNHFDSQAVEEALKVKEAVGEGEVVLVSMGPAG